MQNDEGIYTDNLFNNFMSKSNKSYETKPTDSQAGQADTSAPRIPIRFRIRIQILFRFSFRMQTTDDPRFGSVQLASDRANECTPGVDLKRGIYQEGIFKKFQEIFIGKCGP